jgi:foldase protein PrsA
MTSCSSGSLDKLIDNIGTPDGKTLATVDGTKIKEASVNGIAAYIASTSQQNYDEMDAAAKEQFFNNALQFLIDLECLKAHFRNEGAEPVTAEENTQIKEQAAKIRAALTEGGIDAKQEQITEDVLVSYLESQYYSAKYREEILANHPVTDEEVAAYYEEHKQEYVRDKVSVRSSHILMGDENHTDEDRAAAQTVLDRVNAGEDFAALAKEYSIDTESAGKGGDIGYNDESSTIVESYINAMLKLKAGEVSQLVESEFGFHIIKATDILKPGQNTLEDVAAQIRTKLEEARVAEEYPKFKEGIEIELAE